MKGFHTITGLLRTGSTLLCNILSQNPKFYCSPTSELPGTLAMKIHHWSNSSEVTSKMIHDQKRVDECHRRSLIAEIESEYFDMKNKVVFDKSRGWANNAMLLNELFPKALLIVMIRELRAIFGSIEKQHRKNLMLDHAQRAQGKTILIRADQMFGPEGIIGAPIYAVEDIIRRKPDNVIFVPYEDFANKPQVIMDEIYDALGDKPFQHDFDNVKNVAQDVDELYLGKFEHRGEGKVEPVDSNEWKEYVSEDIGDLIMEKFTFYNQYFGYD